MKVLTTTCLALLLAAASSTAQARDDSSRLAGIRSAMRGALKDKMPGWSCVSIPPMEGSRGVIIEQCEAAGRTVKIAVQQHDSVEDAKESLKQSRVHVGGGKKAQDEQVGEESYTWEVFGSVATAFRKGAVTVYISVVRPNSDTDPVTTKAFAGCIAEVLSPK